MSKYVVGDIHGGQKALVQLFEKLHFHKNDTLIFLGDYVDGWSQSPEVIDFLINISQKYNCIFIKGNHDDLLLTYLKTKEYSQEWFLHGGESTLNAYKKLSDEQIKVHIAFLENLQLYHLDENNNLFIHAGFTNLKGITHEYFKPLFYWDRTLWETALALNPGITTESVLYPKRFKHYNEIYIGHTPVTQINETTPVNRANIWNLDTGAAFKGPLTIMNVDNKEFWQSDPLPILYPDEKGRN